MNEGIEAATSEGANERRNGLTKTTSSQSSASTSSASSNREIDYSSKPTATSSVNGSAGLKSRATVAKTTTSMSLSMSGSSSSSTAGARQRQPVQQSKRVKLADDIVYTTSSMSHLAHTSELASRSVCLVLLRQLARRTLIETRSQCCSQSHMLQPLCAHHRT